MAAIVHGEGLFGIHEPLRPLRFPKGKIRWRIRQDNFVKAFVKTESGIVGYIVKREGNYWVPCVRLGENKREEIS